VCVWGGGGREEEACDGQLLVDPLQWLLPPKVLGALSLCCLDALHVKVWGYQGCVYGPCLCLCLCLCGFVLVVSWAVFEV
jgi:hypothetical protein